MWKETFLASLVVLAVSTISGAEDERNVCFVTSTDLMLRRAPPSGLFYTSGERIGTVSTGDVLAVKEQKNVRTLFGEYMWVQADVLDAKTQERKADGWVYTGKAGSDSYVKKSECGGARQ